MLAIAKPRHSSSLVTKLLFLKIELLSLSVRRMQLVYCSTFRQTAIPRARSNPFRLKTYDSTITALTMLAKLLSLAFVVLATASAQRVAAGSVPVGLMPPHPNLDGLISAVNTRSQSLTPQMIVEAYKEYVQLHKFQSDFVTAPKDEQETDEMYKEVAQILAAEELQTINEMWFTAFDDVDTDVKNIQLTGKLTRRLEKAIKEYQTQW